MLVPSVPAGAADTPTPFGERARWIVVVRSARERVAGVAVPARTHVPTATEVGAKVGANARVNTWDRSALRSMRELAR
eukprot:COSAG03_NODE_5922_length_1147_cov_2.756679_2_plen_78_part_00